MSAGCLVRSASCLLGDGTPDAWAVCLGTAAKRVAERGVDLGSELLSAMNLKSGKSGRVQRGGQDISGVKDMRKLS